MTSLTQRLKLRAGLKMADSGSGKSFSLDRLPLHWSVMLGGVVFFIALLAVGPQRLTLLPGCPLRATTGLLCPGCGTTRALSAITQGEWLAAFRYNPLAISFLASLPLLIGLRYRGYRPSARVIWISLGIILTYFVARNLPFEIFNWIRP